MQAPFARHKRLTFAAARHIMLRMQTALKKGIGILFILGAALCFALMNLFVNLPGDRTVERLGISLMVAKRSGIHA